MEDGVVITNMGKRYPSIT